MFKVVVNPSVQLGRFGLGIRRNVKISAEKRQRHRATENDQWIPETVELGGEDQEDEHQGQAERGNERRAFLPQLPRLTRVVDAIALGQDRRRFILQLPQSLVQGPDCHSADLDGVELLEAIERAGHDRGSQRGHAFQRNQLAVGARDVNVGQLLGIQTVQSRHLGNHAITATGDIEPIDVVAPNHGLQVPAHLLEVHSQVRDLVAVQHDLGLRLIEFHIDQRWEREDARGGGRLRQTLR